MNAHVAQQTGPSEQAGNAPLQDNVFRSWTFGALVAIILLGAALRIYGLASPGLWYDEGCTLVQSKLLDSSFRFFNVDTISDPPVLLTLVRLWRFVLHFVPSLQQGSATYDFLLHLIPCAFSILALPLIFLVCRALTANVNASLLAALLAAISPFQIFYAQELKAYSLYLAIALAALYCLVKALEEDRLFYWIGLVLFESISMYTHFFSVWYITLFNLFFLLTIRRRTPIFLKWVVSQGIMSVLVLPAVLLAFQWSIIYDSIQLNSWALTPTFKSALLTFKTFFAGYGANSLAYWPLFLLAAALFLAGLFLLRRRKNDLLLILLLTVLPVIANVIIWRARNFPFYEHRVFIMSGSICYCVAAYAIASLPGTLARVAVALLICILTAANLPDFYTQNLHPLQTHRMGVRYKVENRAAASFIASEWRPGDFVGHASHFTLMPFFYYLPNAPQSGLRLTEGERTGFLQSLPNEAIWNRYGAIPVRVEKATAGAQRVWLVESWWEPHEIPPQAVRIRTWLDGHFIRDARRAFDGVTVYRYISDPELLLHTETSRIADFGDDAVEFHHVAPTTKAPLEEHLQANTIDQANDVQHRAPAGFGAQFHLGLADSNSLLIDGRQQPCTFGQAERNGQPNAMAIEGVTGQLQIGESARIGGADYSLIALDAPRRRALLASIPLSNAESFNCVLKESAGAKRAIECEVYAAAETILPEQFTASDIASDVWQLRTQVRGSGFAQESGATAIVAELTAVRPQAKPIYTDQLLPPGAYTVFVWTMRTGDLKNQSRAAATFTTRPLLQDGIEKPIGRMKPNDPSAQLDWAWLPAGEIQSDGTPFRFAVTAGNDDRLAHAYFDMGPVTFVEHSTSPAPEELPVIRQTLTLEPASELEFKSQLPQTGGGNKTVNVNFRDSATNEFRRLNWRISR